jgi:hypothetical protein
MPLYKREGGNFKAASYWLREAGSRTTQTHPSNKKTNIVAGTKLRNISDERIIP